MGENRINFDYELLYEKFKSEDYNSCVVMLDEAFKVKRNEKNEVIHVPPDDKTIILIGVLINNLYHKIKTGCSDESELKLIKQCFLTLRNSTACGKDIQNSIIINLNIIESSKCILECLLNKNNAIYIDCLKMELQFLCNLIVSNKNAQFVIWNKFSDLLNICFGRKEVAHIVAMILYNIFQNHDNSIPNDTDFIIKVLDLYKDDIDNIPLLFELLINQNIFTKTYRDLDPKYRLVFLEILYTLILEDSIKLTEELLSDLIDNFKKKSDCILKTVTNYLNNIEPLEVARLLDCISCASSKDNYLKQLQSDKSLFINSAFLLKSIHEAGKNSENNFTAIQKLSEVREGSSEIQEHPGFGFKAALIRLLGNLCWKNKGNQNMIRELDCIPLLMDCCNIDARNPLIIQWVILAVRNLCENNPENQAIIAETTKVGVVDSAIVREMGLTLHDDGGNKIGIAPLNINK